MFKKHTENRRSVIMMGKERTNGENQPSLLVNVSNSPTLVSFQILVFTTKSTMQGVHSCRSR